MALSASSDRRNSFSICLCSATRLSSLQRAPATRGLARKLCLGLLAIVRHGVPPAFCPISAHGILRQRHSILPKSERLMQNNVEKHSTWRRGSRSDSDGDVYATAPYGAAYPSLMRMDLDEAVSEMQRGRSGQCLQSRAGQNVPAPSEARLEGLSVALCARPVWGKSAARKRRSRGRAPWCRSSWPAWSAKTSPPPCPHSRLSPSAFRYSPSSDRVR
jgi:hypothetical protein